MGSLMFCWFCFQYLDSSFHRGNTNHNIVSHLTQISPDSLRNPTSTHRQSKGFMFSRAADRGISREEAQKVHERLRSPAFPQSGPKTSTMAISDQYLKAIFCCCIVMTILVLLPPSNPWVILFVKLSTGITIVLGFLLVRMLISFFSFFSFFVKLHF